jgi:hypothetical protein
MGDGRMRTKALTITEWQLVNQNAAYNTQRLADYFAKAAMVAGDAQKVKRIEERLCLFCFYRHSGIHGQAFTAWKCILCDKPDTHHNTGVPELCRECSEAFDLCVKCGGTIDCQQRSRFARGAKKRRKAPKTTP